MSRARHRKLCEARPRCAGKMVAEDPAVGRFGFRPGDEELVRRAMGRSRLEDVPPTVMAAVLGRFDVLKMLLKKGHPIDATDDEGNTACLWAVQLANVQMTRLLLARGADPGATNHSGEDLLLAAASGPAWSETAFLDLLRLVGDRANTACCDKGGWTALHHAVKRQWRAAAARLLEAGAAADAATSRGVSPLMMAASTGDHDTVRALVAAGADVSREDERGCTPFCYAIAYMMRKRLGEPSPSVTAISSAVRADDRPASVETYIQRRVELLSAPPDGVPDLAGTMSGVVSPVLVFFARFVAGGYQLLLDHHVFRAISEGLAARLQDAAHAGALLSLLARLLQMAEGRAPRPDVADCFVREGAADACLRVLDWYENTKSADEVSRTAMVSLILACSTRSAARVWLQEKYESVRTFYRCEAWSSRCPKHCDGADDPELFRRKCQSFSTLMTNLKNGLSIALPERQGRRTKAEGTGHPEEERRPRGTQANILRLQFVNEGAPLTTRSRSSGDNESLTPRESSEPDASSLDEDTRTIPVEEAGPTRGTLEKSDVVSSIEDHANHGEAGIRENTPANTEPKNTRTCKNENVSNARNQHAAVKRGSGDEPPSRKPRQMRIVLESARRDGDVIPATCGRTKPIHRRQSENSDAGTGGSSPTGHHEENDAESHVYTKLMTCAEHSRGAFLDESLTPDLRALNFLFNSLVNKYVFYWQLDHASDYPLSSDADGRNLEEMKRVIPALEHRNLGRLTDAWKQANVCLRAIHDTEAFNERTLNIRRMILKLDKALDDKIEALRRAGAAPKQSDSDAEGNTRNEARAHVTKSSAQPKPSEIRSEGVVLQECCQVVNSVIDYLGLDEASESASENNDDYDFLFNDRCSRRKDNPGPQPNAEAPGDNPAITDTFLENCINRYISSDGTGDDQKEPPRDSPGVHARQGPRDASCPAEDAPTKECKVVIDDRLFRLAVRPRADSAATQPAAQSRNEQSGTKPTVAVDPAQNKPNTARSPPNYSVAQRLSGALEGGAHLGWLDARRLPQRHDHVIRDQSSRRFLHYFTMLRRASRWDNLMGAFAAMSPTFRQALKGGRLVVSRRETRANFKVAAGLELGVGADGSPVAVRRWRSSAGGGGGGGTEGPRRRLDDALLAAVAPLLGLSHRHVLPYLVAERVDGELLVAAPLCEANLEQHVRELRASSALRAVAKDVSWQIMRGLQFLHSLHPPVVHGNLKPSNVLVDAYGVIRLADFGLGQVLYQLGSGGDEQAAVWWPPERLAQWRWRRPPIVTAPGDVFSAALLAHFAVTGGLHPFGGARGAILGNLGRGAGGAGGGGGCSLRSGDADFVHLATAMLAAAPFERPSARDVLRHVYFWDKAKRWSFMLACAGVDTPDVSPAQLASLHHFIDSTAAAHHVHEDWVSIVQATFPEAAREPATAALSALLRLVRRRAEAAGGGEPRRQLGRYFLAALPRLPLAMFRLLDCSAHATAPHLARFFAAPEL